jgi:DNA segregation ATPase FtsK/SpoIIIE-like protein
MSKWNDFCKSVSQLTEKAIKKTEELTDVASLRIKIKTLEGRISEQYENLGALTYSNLKGGADNAEEVAHIVAKIDSYLAHIATYKLKLSRMEEESKAAKEAAKKAKEESFELTPEETEIPIVDLGPTPTPETDAESGAQPHEFSMPGDDEDPKLVEAITIGVESGKISTSLMQRKLGIGYGRAAKLIDRMEELGWVSAPEGNVPRRVLISKEDFEKISADKKA